MVFRAYGEYTLESDIGILRPVFNGEKDGIIIIMTAPAVNDRDS